MSTITNGRGRASLGPATKLSKDEVEGPGKYWAFVPWGSVLEAYYLN
ncbi:MAG: hypothetical protein HIU84_05510 [Acidobacteria bacterium]|nr:hypothetical protein [Acidobacteriota bacterium]